MKSNEGSTTRVPPVPCPVPPIYGPHTGGDGRRVVKEVGGIMVHVPSYIDNLHCGLNDRKWVESETDNREKMHDLVTHVQKTVTDVAREHALPLTADKEELKVIRGGNGWKTRRNGVV